MGKRLIQQRRGRGTFTYKSPSFNFVSAAKHKTVSSAKGVVLDLVDCPGHSAPLAKIRYEDGEISFAIAPQGLCVGQDVYVGGDVRVGNTLKLVDIPDGTLVFNIESQPGDGGKFVRSSGTFAKIVTRTDKAVSVRLPSKREKFFGFNCRACIGVVAGAGRLEKPFLKAGKKYHASRARNKLFPKTSGISMNAVDHPYGTSRSSKKGHPTIARRNAPPGAKVGKIRPRRTGRRKK